MRAEDARAAARDEEDQREVQERHGKVGPRRCRICSSGTSTTRWAGCVLAFAHLPIFVDLYRSLMVDVECATVPLLISDAVDWASNLAAPDMFWNWAHLRA